MTAEELGPFAVVPWDFGVNLTDPRQMKLQGKPWGSIDPVEFVQSTEWRYHDGLYLFSPRYPFNDMREWLLRKEGDSWRAGVPGSSAADLWPVFMVWKLTGKLERS